MTDEECASFVAASRLRYIDDLVWAGADADVAARTTAEGIKRMFPGGKPSPGHLLFRVEDDEVSVGSLWIGPADGRAADEWYIWEIIIDEGHRGRGIGTQVMGLCEEEVRSRGGVRIRLTVYGFNDTARHVYEKLGYESVSIEMRKQL